MILHVNLDKNSYDIVIDRGCLNKSADLLNLRRKALIVTDSGVPAEYAKTIAAACNDPAIHTIEQGEASKCETVLFELLGKMLKLGFTRKDCVVAAGGGVTGDLAGFAASIYMRGIDFYNIPTTLLSQVDSSIGGKTAIDFMGVKNIVGSFYQPKKVLIDADVLKTLSERQISNGLAEVIKIAATFDEELFSLIESGDALENIEEIIQKSVDIKRRVVEQDEKEHGLRSVLNFGHTLGHGIESEQEGNLYHGECVALGMLPMCGRDVRTRMASVLRKYNLPTEYDGDIKTAMKAILHDKKSDGGNFKIITVDKIGTFDIKSVDAEELYRRISRLNIC